MSENTTETNDSGGIIRNAAGVAFAVFFIATVSAAGGFLQGERVASERIAGVTQTAASNFEFLSKLQTASKIKGSNGEFVQYRIPKGVSGEGVTLQCYQGGNCNAVIDGKTHNLSEAETDSYLDLIKNEVLKTTPDNKVEDSNKANDNKKDSDKNNQSTTKNECGLGSKDPKCLDKCTALFVTLQNTSSTKKAKDGTIPYSVNACIESPKEDPVRKAIDKVVAACKPQYKNWQEVWKDFKCDADPSTKIEDSSKEETSTKAKSTTSIDSSMSLAAVLAVKQGGSKACVAAKKELSLKIKEALDKAKKVPGQVKASELSCNLGAVYCYVETNLSSVEAVKQAFGKVTTLTFNGEKFKEKDNTHFTCCNKHDKACLAKFNQVIGTGANQCAGKSGLQAFTCRVTQGASSAFGGIKDSLAKALGGQNPFGAQQGRGGSSGQKKNQCPSGYKQSSENGKIICTKEDAKKVKPQCLFAASKEKITAGETVALRWRTANATNVTISGGIGSVSVNNQTTVKPTETTKYTLTAKSKDNETETCDVTVTVEGKADGGPTGAAPPKLACTSLIKPDGAATVRWSCTTAADTSTGDGIDTGGRLSGQVTVSPEHNTQYTVTCLDKDKKEIGENVCAVRVGEPQYDIVAEPTAAKRGERVRIAWASLFMKSCTVQGPRGFDYDRTEGVVITEPFATDTQQVSSNNIRAAIYSLECETEFGEKVSKDVSVTLED